MKRCQPEFGKTMPRYEFMSAAKWRALSFLHRNSPMGYMGNAVVRTWSIAVARGLQMEKRKERRGRIFTCDLCQFRNAGCGAVMGSIRTSICGTHNLFPPLVFPTRAQVSVALGDSPPHAHHHAPLSVHCVLSISILELKTANALFPLKKPRGRWGIRSEME